MRLARPGFGVMAAMAAMLTATPVIEMPAATHQNKRQRKQQAAKPQRTALAYPSLNRSRKWRPERSYAEAAVTTAALGLRTRPLR